MWQRQQFFLQNKMLSLFSNLRYDFDGGKNSNYFFFLCSESESLILCDVRLSNPKFWHETVKYTWNVCIKNSLFSAFMVLVKLIVSHTRVAREGCLLLAVALFDGMNHQFRLVDVNDGVRKYIIQSDCTFRTSYILNFFIGFANTGIYRRLAPITVSTSPTSTVHTTTNLSGWKFQKN